MQRDLGPQTVICPYCDIPAKQASGKDVYPHRPDLAEKRFYLCACGAYVGCHPGTWNALGRLADFALRKAKMAAHAAFDPLHKSKQMKRRDAYGWLAANLGIHPLDCHIGQFDVETCERVVAICKGGFPAPERGMRGEG